VYGEEGGKGWYLMEAIFSDTVSVGQSIQ
jgi:hypothetical protein